MDEIDKDFFKVATWFYGVLFLIILTAIVIGNWHYSYMCGNFESITGKQTKYAFLDTCYVRFNDEWLRYSEYKSIRKDLYIREK